MNTERAEASSTPREKMLEELLKNLLAAIETGSGAQISIAADAAYDYLEATR